jgi:hypothetical protein
MVSIPKVEQLRKEVQDLVKEHPLQYLITEVRVNENGKVTGRMPNLLSDDPQEKEQAMRANMFKQSHWHYEVDAYMIIEPVRRQLVLEHSISASDFSFIVSNNPLIPEGREFIYAQGLLAGMEGNFLVMAHLLIPQFEHSIRYLLAQHGIITSGIDDESIQDEYNLNKTLYLPKTKEILGEDITFTLQGILVERFGANLRNRMTHGLMPFAQFYSSEVEYFWWLILRLCCWPLLTTSFKNKG